jgi:alkylation response protein AidB-like acyl-CoA dehydrogenase
VSQPKLPPLPKQLGFSEEHALLGQSARRLMSERWDAATLRGFVDGDAAARQAADELGATMDELGWTQLALAADDGGAGLGWLHATLLAEELGRVLSPVRWATRMLAAVAARRATGRGAITHSMGDVEVSAAADGLVLNGRHLRVPGGAGADFLVAPHRIDGERRWLVVDLAGAECVARTVQDPTRPMADLTLDAAAADLLELDEAALMVRARLLHAAEAIGAAQTLLAMMRHYACERQQFGRAIGSFQAVSHPIVDTLIAVEQARNLVLAGAAAIDAQPDVAQPDGAQPDDGADGLGMVSRMAKLAADEALWNAAQRAVQIHGGFGFTWECDVHFFLRRAMSSRAELGAASELRAELGSRLVER